MRNANMEMDKDSIDFRIDLLISIFSSRMILIDIDELKSYLENHIHEVFTS